MDQVAASAGELVAVLGLDRDVQRFARKVSAV
jgi:hypothetical protein